MSAINIARLYQLIDLGEAALSAERHARGAYIDATQDLREARAATPAAVEIANRKAASAEEKGQDRSAVHLKAKAESLLANLAGLQQRVERRKAALEPLARRATAWQAYLDNLRTLAKQHGVTTA